MRCFGLWRLPIPMPEHARNPNRDLPADEVRALVREKLPHRADDLEADRLWLWLPCPGGKPSEEDRTILKDLGFRFTPAFHRLPDGSSAHWYHAAGHPVFRRRRGTRNNSEGDTETQPASVVAFLAFAEAL